MAKKFLTLLITIFIIVNIIKVEYVSVPIRDNRYNTEYRQEVKITFEDGVMQVPSDRIEQTIIPIGRVEMVKDVKFNNEFYATYKFKKVK